MRLPELPRNWPRNALGTTIVCAFVAAGAWVLSQEFPRDNARIVYFMLGQLSSFVGLIVNFHFGQTEGQRRREFQEHDTADAGPMR